jgi:glycosyltransferase involved in cell wall biosynthesis
MHIGFDAKRFFHNATGLGNYARNTLRGLIESFPRHSYRLYTPRLGAHVGTSAAHPAVSVQEACPLGRALPALWRSLGIPHAAKNDLDIYHGLSHELPLTRFAPRTRTVVSMHDLLFLTHPQLYPWLDRRIYAIKYKASCQRADLIVAISQKTADDVAEWFDISPERIRVAYQSCDPAFYAAVDETEKKRLRAAHGLPLDYVLFVGSLIARKGCRTLVEALASLAPTDRPALALVGTGPEEKALRQQVHALGLDTVVHFLGRVPAKDLPGLYQAATAFAYPSVGEGFGIPILEALFSRVPVITSTGSCFAEPGGDAALYTTPGDASELAHALGRVLNDADLRADMIDCGLRHAEKFHLIRTSERLMNLYTELCPGR